MNRPMIELNSSALENKTHDILQIALNEGATSAEIHMGVSKGFSVTARQGDVESVEYHQDKHIEITVYVGQRTGSASLSDFRPEAITAAVRAACHIARSGDDDVCAGLADKEDLAWGYPTPSIAYPWELTVPEAIELARECEAKAYSYDKRITHSEGVSVSTTESQHVYGNTHGFIGVYPVTRHELSCMLIASQGDEMQRGYDYTVSCDPHDLTSIQALAQSAAERTVSRLGAQRLTTKTVPVIFVAEEARGLLGHFVSAMSGSQLYRKSSFLLDQLGEAIFPSFIHIHEDPFLLKGLGSAPFDDDGVSARANVFVQEGLLKQYCLGVYSARKLAMKTTGNAGGVHNLLINSGNHDLSGLLRKMDKGLLVTELMGQGINLTTGDYSRGAFGFWVERGEIQYPVEEITIAGRLQEMYRGLIDVGNDVDKRGNVRTGSLLIDRMIVAGLE